jgi:hypothetical protein
MRPVLSIRQLENELGTTFSVAKRYVEKLVQAGILKELTGFARNRIYRAEEIYKALAQTGEWLISFCSCEERNLTTEESSQIRQPADPKIG